ncbi:unnamed protein product [Didymodactylos carnosus]|uniref:Uncharacterized protein n=1 Tax=Didymodactylos carnosus TaxID=1234261 RepID=A0A814FF03_9BILA|nr:unnamed protein product [Didymodactylos carnosus]CAF3756485.1 unnamed protein product [Didymodactylos carnosus]
MLLYFYLFIYTITLISSNCPDIFLKPVKHDKKEIALIFIPGVELPPDRHVPLLTNLQYSSDYLLWIGKPQFPFNLPTEQTPPRVIEESQAEKKS